MCVYFPAANNGVNLPVRPVTSLANSASAAPVRPAGYAERSADEERICSNAVPIVGGGE